MLHPQQSALCLLNVSLWSSPVVWKDIVQYFRDSNHGFHFLPLTCCPMECLLAYKCTRLSPLLVCCVCACMCAVLGHYHCISSFELLSLPVSASLVRVTPCVLSST